MSPENRWLKDGISFPIASMVYVSTFTKKIIQMQVNIPYMIYMDPIWSANFSGFLMFMLSFLMGPLFGGDGTKQMYGNLEGFPF